jgi:hypothetical protein
VVADVEMVAAGITGRRAVCRLARAAAGPGLTRSAHAVRLAYEEVGPGAVWVVGCAPTALEELIALDAAPALVIGMPVGFVGAAESKAHLRASGLPAVSNISEKGGSAVAAAALNALLYAADDGHTRDPARTATTPHTRDPAYTATTPHTRDPARTATPQRTAPTPDTRRAAAPADPGHPADPAPTVEENHL